MSNLLKINLDMFIEKTDYKIETEYQVYRIQKDGWYNIDNDYIKEKAIVTNSLCFKMFEDAEERLNDYLSISNREGMIIKRVIITIIDINSPLIRNTFISETIVKHEKS